jgi:hypothetical protein
MDWGALVAVGLMCFIFGLAKDAFDFWGAVIGRSVGEWQMAKCRQRAGMTRSQARYVRRYPGRYPLLNEHLAALRARDTPAPGPRPSP